MSLRPLQRKALPIFILHIYKKKSKLVYTHDFEAAFRKYKKTFLIYFSLASFSALRLTLLSGVVVETGEFLGPAGLRIFPLCLVN